MANRRKVVKVFLASPGDMVDERKSAKKIAEKFNSLWADEYGYQVDLVGWEDTVSGVGRPQAIINEDLDKCEYFIGIMGARWGTPPDKSGKFTSGFEEEFTRALEKYELSGKPEISLYFKTIDSDRLDDPGAELKKVLDFQEKIRSERIVLYEPFSEGDDFQNRIERCLTKYIQKLKTRDRQDETQDISTNVQDENFVDQVQHNSDQDHLLSIEGANFLSKLVDENVRRSTEDQLLPIDVARLRLLGDAVGQYSNDDRQLGTHDANILYKARKELVLSQVEVRKLVETGLENIDHQNIPLWYWLNLYTKGNLTFTFSLSVIGQSDGKRIGAIKAMRLLSEKMPKEGLIDRNYILNNWFDASASDNLKVAALGYLSELGTADDLEAIATEIVKADYQTASAAIEANLMIRSRDSREDAIRALFQTQSTTISKSLVGAILEKLHAIDVDLLVLGLEHRSVEVRRKIVGELVQRKALQPEQIEPLIKDDDVSIRYSALVFDFKYGGKIHTKDARRILNKPKQSSFGLFGAIGTTSTDEKAAELFGNFQKLQLHSLSLKKLRDLAQKKKTAYRQVEFSLAERVFGEYGNDLRQMVVDHFTSEFASYIDWVSFDNRGSPDDRILKLLSKEEEIRSRLTREGLSILTRKGSASDILIFRRTLQSGFVKLEEDDFEFIGKFGEWQDINLIKTSLNNMKQKVGAFLIGVQDEQITEAAALAILKLGKGRMEEVLDLEIPVILRTKLIEGMARNEFAKFSTGSLLGLLFSEDAILRKKTVIKCVQVLTKNRIKNLMESYLSSEDGRYYNVIHWLDLGVSMPRKISKDIALRASDIGL